MSDVNVTVVGHVGQDPALYTSSNGTRWTSLRVASTRRLRDPGSGEWRDGETTWFTVRAYGDRAQNVVDSLGRGTPVVVTGRLAFEEFEVRKAQAGPDGRAVEVVRPGYAQVVENATIAVDVSRGVARYTRTVRTEALPGGAPQSFTTGTGGSDAWETAQAGGVPEGENEDAEDVTADVRETVGV